MLVSSGDTIPRVVDPATLTGLIGSGSDTEWASNEVEVDNLAVRADWASKRQSKITASAADSLDMTPRGPRSMMSDVCTASRVGSAALVHALCGHGDEVKKEDIDSLLRWYESEVTWRGVRGRRKSQHFVAAMIASECAKMAAAACLHSLVEMLQLAANDRASPQDVRRASIPGNSAIRACGASCRHGGLIVQYSQRSSLGVLRPQLSALLPEVVEAVRHAVAIA